MRRAAPSAPCLRVLVCPLLPALPFPTPTLPVPCILFMFLRDSQPSSPCGPTPVLAPPPCVLFVLYPPEARALYCTSCWLGPQVLRPLRLSSARPAFRRPPLLPLPGYFFPGLGPLLPCICEIALPSTMPCPCISVWPFCPFSAYHTAASPAASGLIWFCAQPPTLPSTCWSLPEGRRMNVCLARRIILAALGLLLTTGFLDRLYTTQLCLPAL